MPKMINADKCMLLVIDIQEKLVKMLNNNMVAKKASIIAQIARHLEIPAIITEQYPQGLGNTIPEVKLPLDDSAQILEKICFSAYAQDDFKAKLKNLNKKQILICGIEMHICVIQTALELLSEGYEIYIIKDACGSRNIEELELATDRLKQENATIVSTEMILFELLKSAKHPKFKELQSLIK